MTDTAPSADAPELDPKWLFARDLFRSGETAAAVSRQISVSPSTFWAKAAEHGWLRRDQTEETFAPPPIDPDAAALTHLDAVEEAWGRAMTALRAGHAAEARSWMRVRADLQADLARHDQERRRERLRHLDELTRTARGVEARARAELSEVQAALKAGRVAAAQARSEKMDKLSADSDARSPLDPEQPGISRAERRRRLKYLAKTRPPAG